MSDPSQDPTILEAWRQLANDMPVLALAGLAGAFLRALISPESGIKRRIIQGIGGIISALFLGGALSNIVTSMLNVNEINAILASGFLMGVSGEAGVKAMQNKIYGKEGK